MIGTLAWKEYREHQTVWVAMTALAVLLLVSLTQIWAPHGVASAPADKLVLLAFAALILAATYGLICGAMMVAGEEEARTQTFLDSLPAHRLRLWITKLLIGILFTFAYALAVTGIVAGLGLTELKNLPPGWQLALPFVALETFGYGLFGSVLGRSVLAAVGWAFLPVAASWILGGPIGWPPSIWLIGVRATLLVGLLGLACFIYCRQDLQRGLGGSADFVVRRSVRRQRNPDLEDDLPSSRRARRGASSENVGVLVWLALRQGGPQLVLFLIAGFLTGLLLPNAALTIWPIASLLVGVMFGIGMFGSEQGSETFRFLGDQRLSPDRVWLIKAITWAAMAASVMGVLLLGAAIHLSTTQGAHRSVPPETHLASFLGSRLLLDYVPKDIFMLLWPVYGFSIGQFLAMICRKSAVALVLSLLVSVPIVGVWIPSLVAGGLKLWQVLPFAVLLLLATRWALWAWAGALLKTWRPVLGLLTCAVLAGTWLLGNLVYRAVEVPAVGRPSGVGALMAELRAPEENRVATLIHNAMIELNERAPSLSQSIPGDPDGDALTQILARGWPADNAELESWLDRICQGEWVEDLRAAAALPPGVVENPRLFSAAVVLTAEPVYVRRPAQVLAARALQLQARGMHAEALDHLLWALALSRNLRYHTLETMYQEGQAVEAVALQGLDRWLERLGSQTALLEQALAEMSRHEALTPSASDPIEAEYLLLRERLDGPSSWLFPGAANAATAALEYDLITLTLQTPWERERAERFLDALTQSRLKEVQTPYWQLPLNARLRDNHPVLGEDAYPVSLFVPDGAGTSFSSEQWERLLADSRLLLRLFALSSRPQHEKQAWSLCRVRAARLKLALALYQIHEGKPARTLTQLVPRYMEELPPDPFSGEPFHYSFVGQKRILGGNLAQVERADRSAVPAEAILWSVGPDGTQSLGRREVPFIDPEGGEEQFPFRPDPVFRVPFWFR